MGHNVDGIFLKSRRWTIQYSVVFVAIQKVQKMIKKRGVIVQNKMTCLWFTVDNEHIYSQKLQIKTHTYIRDTHRPTQSAVNNVRVVKCRVTPFAHGDDQKTQLVDRGLFG